MTIDEPDAPRGALASELDERLAEAAALAAEVAPRLCAPAADGAASCAWYHALYPALRLLELAATPEREAAFYHQAFGELARDGGYQRIAITGAADACMLAHLLWSYRRAGARPRVEVVDRCATPLRLCDAYAARVGADVHTTVADVLGWVPATPLDLITTHSFLGMFPRAAQPALVASWRRALRPGGKVVSVARIDPSWTPAYPGFSASQSHAFQELVVRRVQERRALLPDGQATWAERARQYARRMRSFPLPSPAALVTLLAEAGFTVDRLDLVRLEGNAAAGESGPGTHRPGTFAHFVAAAAA